MILAAAVGAAMAKPLDKRPVVLIDRTSLRPPTQLEDILKALSPYPAGDPGPNVFVSGAGELFQVGIGPDGTHPLQVFSEDAATALLKTGFILISNMEESCPGGTFWHKAGILPLGIVNLSSDQQASCSTQPVAGCWDVLNTALPKVTIFPFSKLHIALSRR